MEVKKSKTSKSKMKKMYAAVQAIYDREDLEDAEVTIIEVYASKKSAQKALDEAEEQFLRNASYDDSNEFDIDDCDCIYDWHINEVEVES